MKLFLIWAGHYNELKHLIMALQKKGHKIIYWVGLGNGEGKIPGAIFHNHFAAWDGLPAPGQDIQEFPPPSRELVKRYSRLESLALTMMNKHYDGYCVDDRKHTYYNMLQYWHGIMKKHKPEVIIFPVIPHSVYNYIIYQLARDWGIKTMMFDNPELPDNLLFYTDWQEGDISLQKAIQDNQGKNFSLTDLSHDLQEYYKPHIENQPEASPALAVYLRKRFTGFNKVKRKIEVIAICFKNGILLKRTVNYLIKQFKPNLKKEYRTIQTEPDFSKSFVYVPLHFQPERTICPQGDVFVDQILMVETISSALPRNWLVYVKEHPVQWWLRCGINYSCNRYPGYYRRLAKIKNVRLLPVDTDSFTLINKSQAVATVTGTAGWEAMLRRKPAIIFGYPWYRDCPGLLRVDSADGCREAFKKIIEGFRPDHQQIINYLKCVDNVAIKGFVAPPIERTPPLSFQQSMANMTKKILAKLEEFSNSSV